ncbi:hypothetical protein B9Z19DRAFT_249382 [Tuber borchii]|uniref:Uncharacterized protein n=1 Tax=Tuber borchii TaxID=42251 RepID=A0A2T6ZM06_TUBBO|nr:hypothetical protein B9Z19DRAFT_249382 [Tuber borchii]
MSGSAPQLLYNISFINSLRCAFSTSKILFRDASRNRSPEYNAPIVPATRYSAKTQALRQSAWNRDRRGAHFLRVICYSSYEFLFLHHFFYLLTFFEGMLVVGVSYFRFLFMIVFLFSHVIPLFSLSFPKGYFKIGVYMWEYIVTCLLPKGCGLVEASVMFFVSLLRFSRRGLLL